jgi:hypothetical protein
MIFVSLTGITGYFSIDYISGAVSELLPDIQIYTSMIFIVQFLTIFFSAVFLQWVSISEFSDKKSLFLQTGAFLLSLCSITINIVMLFKSGFGWIGTEFFHGQSIASNSVFNYLGILLFVIILISASISGSILFKKSEAKGYKDQGESN